MFVKAGMSFSCVLGTGLKQWMTELSIVQEPNEGTKHNYLEKALDNVTEFVLFDLDDRST